MPENILCICENVLMLGEGIQTQRVVYSIWMHLYGKVRKTGKLNYSIQDVCLGNNIKRSNEITIIKQICVYLLGQWRVMIGRSHGEGSGVLAGFCFLTWVIVNRSFIVHFVKIRAVHFCVFCFCNIFHNLKS